ncbi:MAG: CCA tRNA nucleotidyltransferase [Aquificae bacterium]|nr:CCA tRNA nucleotidyltransferase [Aquificota bacterium]
MEINTAGKHTLHGLNFYLSYFDDIAKLLPREDYCFIVGGWVRDRILGEEIGYNVDVDFLTTADPVELAKKLAEKLGGHFFVFEKKGFLIKRPVVASVVLHLPPYRYRFDFSPLRGKDLEKALVEDLKERDFTANAMAVSLDDVLSIGAKQTIVYDPTGGIKDLERGLLRPVSLENLKKDPVRILRGFRIAIERDLKLTEDFYEFVRENPALVLKSAPERITHELFKIMKEDRSHEVIRELYRYRVLESIIPQIGELRKVKDQGEHHVYPLDEHTLMTLKYLEDILKKKEEFLSGELLSELGKLRVLGEFTDLELLKWGALLHDIGKPRTFRIREGKVTFYEHDKVGQEIVSKIGKSLRWGEEATRFVGKLVRHHLRPFYLREALKKGQLTKRGMARFWKDCGDVAPHLFLLSLADALASGDEEEDLKALKETINELERFRKELKKSPQKPLLSGHDIMKELGIKPGKLVGEIKRALEEAQLEGRVKTREEALKYAREVYEKLAKVK